MNSTNNYVSFLQGLFIVFFSISVTSIAHGQPIVSGLNGTISHSNSVTISGSGFGTKSSQNGAAPVAFGDMENSSVSARIGSWSETGYPSGVMSTSTLHQRNSNSTRNAECNITTGNTVCAFSGGSDAPQWFVQYWFYLDSSDWTWGSGNNKIFRMWSTGGSSTVNLRLQLPWNNVDLVVEGADEAHGGWGTGWQNVTGTYTCADQAFGHSCDTNYWNIGPGSIMWKQAASDLTRGAWHLFQFEYQDGGVNTANGVLRWWADGKLILDHTDIKTRTSSDSSYKRPKIVGIYASNTGDATGHFYLDDVYIDNTWQRVEIGNNTTYNNCTLKEIQPTTSWSDGSITFKVNQGSFANGATGYLFVTDASGTRNTGQTVTFGSIGGDGGTADGGTADTAAPTVSISAPSPSASVSGNASVTASASDNIAVSKVDFYVDSTSSTAIATDTTAPYSFTWNTTAVVNGSHTLYAKASDAAGNSKITTGVTVTVSNVVVDSTSPTVSITSPASGSVLTGNTAVTASASDNIGITKVDFFVDNTSSTAVGTATSSPYLFTWDPSAVANGTHTLYARASDAAGNTKVASISVTVAVPSSSSPSGAIIRNECTSPPSGSVFCEDFEGSSPKSHFDDYDGNPDTENLIVTDNGPAGDSSNKAVRFRVPTGQAGTSDMLKVLPATYDKLYARWYFKYEPGFNFSAPNHGGGLSAGNRSFLGQSGNRPSGSDFASFSLQYNEQADLSQYHASPYVYTYSRNMYQNCADPNGSCWGDSYPCLYDSGSPSCTKPQDRPTVTLPTLVAGQWYCYEQMIDMGTASTSGSGATGRITQWLNGNLFGDNANLWLRTSADLKLQNLWLALYHHDGTHSAVGELIDNVVVSTQRIGCGGVGAISAVGNLRPVQIIP